MNVTNSYQVCMIDSRIKHVLSGTSGNLQVWGKGG